MREKKNYRIITFHTTSAAMAMEKYCGENHINGRLIPVPRQLSADCGLAWRMEPAEYEQKKEQIHTFGIDRKSTRLNSSHPNPSRMPSSA